MGKLTVLCTLVIALASFAPHPLRGGIILLCCVIAIVVSAKHYSPFAPTPDLPTRPDPEVDEAQALIEKFGVENAKTKK